MVGILWGECESDRKPVEPAIIAVARAAPRYGPKVFPKGHAGSGAGSYAAHAQARRGVRDPSLFLLLEVRMKSFTLPLVLSLLGCVAGSGAHAQPARTDFLLGSAAEVPQATRTVRIDAQTPWVNVMSGETVLFEAGAARFAWRFDGPGTRSFDLQRIAPAGALARPVPVYITRVTARAQ
jgi:hypothetical protein